MPPASSAERNRRSMTITVTILGITLLSVLMAYFVIGDSNDREGLDSLKMVSILFRHGDRTPNSFYANDPHAHHVWPGGLGALTEKGVLQMYNLGTHLRHRYYKLLPPSGLYNKANMLVQSSAADRCLMSGSAFLAGFMPPLKHHNQLPVEWQPVPINSMPRLQDYLIAQKKPCPKYDEALRFLYENGTKELQELNAANADLYEFITKHSGQNFSNILDADRLYNTLKVEEDAGLTLPQWTHSVYPKRLHPLAERSFTVLTDTPYMKRVKGGAMLSEIVDHMDKKRLTLLDPDRSIFIYSGHDVTLVNVMSALDIVDQTSSLPDYGASLVMELHYNSITFQDDFEVRLVYYFNHEDKFPKLLRIPNCVAPCSLTAFAESVDAMLWTNYDDLCKLA